MKKVRRFFCEKRLDEAPFFGVSKLFCDMMNKDCMITGAATKYIV